MPLRALARVNLAAIERNVQRVRRELAGGARLCAVVKAGGYGHGAAPAARAALAGGATKLAVATAVEAAELRAEGIGAPILVMGALSDEELPVALGAGAEVVAWTRAFVADVARCARSSPAVVQVHVKLDTGMGRLGTRDGEEALQVADDVLAHSSELRLTGAMTHMATADEDSRFLSEQLVRFEPFVRALRSRVPALEAHAANSAATLRTTTSHLDLVRCGIAIYGCDPMHEDPATRGLEPALELSSYVAAVKLARPGESAGYGRRFIATQDTWVATAPIGYADGVRRALTNNCDVLIGGRRYPLAGTVSMDNITVALGPQQTVAVGERMILIGRDGRERQTAEDLARRVGTINYEILCGISARVPRSYHRDGQPVT
jgi:alanine racemase